MALYLGNSNKLIINLDGIAYRLNLFSATPVVDHISLLSYDNYILTDKNGIYLMPSDYVEVVVDNIILSRDGYILKDFNGLYLIPKEEL